MKNILIMNYAFQRYYYVFNNDGNFDLNIDDKEDRIKLLCEVFNHSNIDFKDNKSQFDYLIKSFYDSSIDKDYVISSDLLNFTKYSLISNNIQDLEQDLVDILVWLNEKFSEVYNLELYEKFKEASLIMREIFGDEFPVCDEELVAKCYSDKSSPYYYTM